MVRQAHHKIAIVIAFRDFRDVEYFIPADIFRNAGAKITTISSKKGIAIGVDGGEAKIDLTPDEFRPENFDAVIFIGGPGMGKNLDNQDFQKIAKDAIAADKVIGAICIAPALLAKAGVLLGKKATIWSDHLNKFAAKILKEGGAVYQDEDVVVDGKLITANGPAVAKEFAEKIIEVLRT